MKRLFIAVLCLSSMVGFSQMTLTKLDGTPINNGDVFTYNVTTEPGAYLGIKIYNNTEEDFLIKAQVLDIINSDGTNLQFCVADVCLLSVTEGNIFPGFPASIPANGENSNFDHFVNYNPGIDPTQPVEYVLSLFARDESGNPLGSPVTFTYRYVPALAVSDHSLASIGIAIKSTIVSDRIEVLADDALKIAVYDVNGKMLLSQNLAAGAGNIDVSGFSSGVYIANFTNALGRTASARIVKK